MMARESAPSAACQAINQRAGGNLLLSATACLLDQRQLLQRAVVVGGLDGNSHGSWSFEGVGEAVQGSTAIRHSKSHLNIHQRGSQHTVH